MKKLTEIYLFTKKCKKFILFYRINDWIHILGLILLGYAYSQPHFDQINFRGIIIAFTVGSLYLAHGYSINDIYDNQIKINIPYRNALFLSLLPLILCLIGSIFISLNALYTVTFGHLCGMFYSITPFRFKNKVFLDLIFNSFCFPPLFILGYLIEKTFNPKVLILSFIFFIYFISIQLIHQIHDYTLDIQFKQNNTVQVFGIKKAIYLTFFFLLIYVYINYLFWKWHLLKPFALFLSCFFSAAVTFYLIHKKLIRDGLKKYNLANFKLIPRYISIIYGVGLLIAFYLNI